MEDFTLSLATVRSAIAQLLAKASKEAVTDPEDEIPGVGSGFGGADEDKPLGKDALAFSRPVGVTDTDWRVYEVLDEMYRELMEKYRAMWA